ncbi:PAS and ANTAR domain-containing protein [Rhodococcus pyridinivorans]|uniref:PAS and ANTAR domain-containing protein n=1 Tax=Rhodococcus pyridinivorans TaxID=103816 RepID=UPI0009BFB093|nr:PAS and ANTAR domain-containing protein [Rhodococcus pyridinivorans]
MSDSPTDEALSRILADDVSRHVGSFRYLSTDDSWEWSASVARIHGYEPGTVVPTTELVLRHKHPDDREDITTLLTSVRTTGEPFSSRHRIVDTRGTIRHVVVIGDRIVDEDGTVLGTSGFYLDLTDALEEDLRAAADAAMASLADARAVIEQAKGALMLAYTIPAERAFEILVWRSQETNVKLRALAERLVHEISTTPGILAEFRGRFDHLFPTVHERIRSSDPPPPRSSDPLPSSIERPAPGYSKVESRPAPHRSLRLRALRREESHDPGCGETLERPPHSP